MIFPGCSSFASGDARVHHANWLQKNRPFNISSKPFMWNIYICIDAHLHSISWSGCRVLQTFDASLLRFCLCFAKATWQWPWCDCTWRHVQDLGRALCPGRNFSSAKSSLCSASRPHSMAKKTSFDASSICSLKEGKSAHEFSKSTTFLASPRSAAPDWINSFNSGRKVSMLKPGIACVILPSIHISISCMYSLWIVV